MKKSFLAALIIVLMFTFVLAGCSENLFQLKVEGKQDTSYAVTSNGGSAVQYGNYVYFINGYRGYADENGADNYWGDVKKGALYRAELNGYNRNIEYMTPFGAKHTIKTFESVMDETSEFNFKSTLTPFVTGYEKDDDGLLIYDDNDEPIEVVEEKHVANVTMIASKTIGTTGYQNGGIYIFDDYVYYASPSRTQDRAGTIEVNKTTFFRSKLDGTNTQQLYATKNDSSDSPYAFYKQNGKMYLVVLDGTDIISVTIGNRVESVKKIAEDIEGADNVLFPVNDVYFNGIDTNTAADFIYFTRSVTDTDSVRAGNIAECMRPSGEERMIIRATEETITLNRVDGGYLFYHTTENGGIYKYTNLHENFMEHSPSYKASYEANVETYRKINGATSPILGHQSGTTLSIENVADYDEVICFRPNLLSNQTFALALSGDGLFLFRNNEMTEIYNDAISQVFALRGNDVYFGDGNGGYCKTNLYTPYQDNEAVIITSGASTEATFMMDVMGDLVMVFGKVDDYADNYALFVDVTNPQVSAQFVGEKLDDEVYDPEVELTTADTAE